MQEKSLRMVGTDKTFFNKLSNTISKLLLPTKLGINNLLITIKRNNVLKAYEQFKDNENDELEKKYDDLFALYLEDIDKNVMDSIYKKVKNNSATDFERDALSRYYLITQLKDTEYVEYKYMKQKYLLELDNENIQLLEKQKIIDRYNKFYVSKMEAIYKGLLKHYSVKLSDNIMPALKEEIYEKIFSTIEEYIEKILPVKIKYSENETYKEVLDAYDKFEKYTVGKLDQNDNIEKKMVLLGISRRLFTHSLPLIVAEQCYIKLLKDTRALIVDTRIKQKQNKAYEILLNIIEEYNIKLLSTKVYWDKPTDREEYKKFWNKYKKVMELKDSNYLEYLKQREILFIKSDLEKVYSNENKYYKIIKYYKQKLVELGVMREIKNNCKSYGNYVKKVV